MMEAILDGPLYSQCLENAKTVAAAARVKHFPKFAKTGSQFSHFSKDIFFRRLRAVHGVIM